MIRFSLSVTALALALPAVASAQSVQDFQLPPNPTPTPAEAAPQVQGPVDIEAPLETTPRQVPTAQPTQQPTAAPTTAPQPAQRAPVRPEPEVSRQTPRFTPARQQARLPQASDTSEQTAEDSPDLTPTAETAEPVTESSLPGFSTDFPATTAPEAAQTGTSAGGLPWGWIAAFAALMAALVGFVFWRRRQAAQAVPATIAPPLVKGEASAPAAPAPKANGRDQKSALSEAPATPPSGWLKIEAHALELQRTMMNANLTYRLVIANRSGKALTDLAIEADLATAHGKAPVEEQLASSSKALQLRETIERLAPGERLELRSSVLLPLSDAKIIQQGPKALLCIPLLRVRAVCEDREPIARTWVIGQQNAETRGRVQPFRFDAPPQTYRSIGQRALD